MQLWTIRKNVNKIMTTDSDVGTEKRVVYRLYLLFRSTIFPHMI